MNSIVLLRQGTKYGPEYVTRLAREIRRYDLATPIYCATDDIDAPLAGVTKIPLSDNDLTGWWGKMSLFRPRGAFDQIKGRILYLDLDVALFEGATADIFNYPSNFAMHQDFHKPYSCASAVMLFEAGTLSWIWNAFKADCDNLMRRFQGDQQVLQYLQEQRTRYNTNQNYHAHCDFLPQRWIRSYKMHAQAAPPYDCKIVCFHGDPKPAVVKDGWVNAYWQS